MTGNLWLIGTEHLDEEANTDLVVANQVEQAQSRAISERFKEQFHAVILIASHLLFGIGIATYLIRIPTLMSSSDSAISRTI